jgi:DNA primase
VAGQLVNNSPLQDTGRRYLLGRRLTERTLKEFRIGQIGDAKKLLASAREIFGVERLYKSGLVSKYQDNSYSGLVFNSGYLLFPFLDDEKCQYLQARAIGDAASGPRWKCLHGLQPTIYNIGALRSTKKVFLCEGVTDVLSAYELIR